MPLNKETKPNQTRNRKKKRKKKLMMKKKKEKKNEKDIKETEIKETK